ncbi:Polysaccharide biosynthesis protein [uncultured archaeon]|nr:Polysaccharide biosynthesis protein [uncultured archaeon]
MEISEETSALAKGTIWQNIGSIGIKLVSFFYTILIARLVSQDEVGLFYFGISLAGIVGILADFGISQTVQRYVPFYLGKGDKVSARRIIHLSIVLGSLLMLLAAAVFFLAAPDISAFFSNPGLLPLLAILAVYLLINQAFNIAKSVLASLQMMKERSVGDNVQNVLKVLLTLALIFTMGPSAAALTWAFLLSFAAALFYLFWALYRALKKVQLLPPAPGHDWYLPLLRETLPFGLTMVSILMFTVLLTYTDRVMLGYLLQTDANAQIAIYALATSLATMIPTMAGSVVGILLPVASGLAGRAEMERINKAAQTSLRWVIFSSVPLAAFLAAFAAPSLTVLYGASYEPGALSLMLFCLGLFLYLLGTVQSTLIAAHRLVKLELTAFAAGALANIALNWVLVPPFGISGSAFASMVSLALIALINHFYATREFGFRFPPTLWRHLLSAALLFAFLFGLEQVSYPYLIHLPIPISDGSLLLGTLDKVVKAAVLGVFFGIGGLAYLLLLNLLRLFEHEDRHVFEKIVSKMGVPAKWRGHLSALVFWSLPKAA